MPHQPCAYILASRPRGALYIGVTRDIAMRVWLHKQGKASWHTAKYNIKRLVWLEHSPTMPDAIALEKRLKNWHRAWKIDLIETSNPRWHDLYETLNA